MGVNWASFVTSLSRDRHVTKITNSNSERTIAVRAFGDHTLYKACHYGSLLAFGNILCDVLSRDSHVTKISRSNSERMIAVRAHCDNVYQSL